MIWYIENNDTHKILVNPKQKVFGNGRPFPWKRKESAEIFLQKFRDEGYNVCLKTVDEEAYKLMSSRKKPEEKEQVFEKLSLINNKADEWFDGLDIDELLHTYCEICVKCANRCKQRICCTLSYCPQYRMVQ